MTSFIAYWIYDQRKKNIVPVDYKTFERDPYGYIRKWYHGDERLFEHSSSKPAIFNEPTKKIDKVYQVTYIPKHFYLVACYTIFNTTDKNRGTRPYSAYGSKKDSRNHYFKRFDITAEMKKEGIVKPWKKFPPELQGPRGLTSLQVKVLEDLIIKHKKQIIDLPQILKGENSHDKVQDITEDISSREQQDIPQYFPTLEQQARGKRGEEYFFNEIRKKRIFSTANNVIFKWPITGNLDCRKPACGHDFNCSINNTDVLVEIKTYCKDDGRIFITEGEWKQAMGNRDKYWIIGLKEIQANKEYKAKAISGKKLKEGDWEIAVRWATDDKVIGQ